MITDVHINRKYGDSPVRIKLLRINVSLKSNYYVLMKKPLIILFVFLVYGTVSAQDKDTLKVGYTTAPPFIIDNNGTLEGINVLLWERVAQDLELEYMLVPMEFSDMLQAVENGDIDVCINPLTITSERHKKMIFTDAFYASHSTIAVSKSSSLQTFFRFVKSFFNVNFLKGLGALLFIIFVFGLLGWYFERRKNPNDFRKGLPGLWDGLWWSAVTLTTVGYGDKAPQSRGGKITALILMFGGLLFISGLTASIASSLTVNEISANPDSLIEFKERPVGSVKNSSSVGFLKSHFFKDVTMYDNVEQGLTALNNETIDAFMYDEPILKYRKNQDKAFADIELIPVKFDAHFYAFAIAKQHADLENNISQKILEMIESQEWQLILNEFGLTEI